MGELADKAKQRSPFLRLEAGESIVGTYEGYKMIPSSYDPEKEVFRFIIGIEIGGEKLKKYWDTGSNKVAEVIDTLKVGDKLKITKNVKMNEKNEAKTSWECEAYVEEKKK